VSAERRFANAGRASLKSRLAFDKRGRLPYAAPVPVLDLLDLPAACPPGTPWLGLDLGENTIGVAASDTSRMIASPLELIRKVKFTQDAGQLIKLMNGRNVSALVIGLPMNMDGTEGPRAQSCRAFARNLDRIRPVNIAFWDERLSTSAVERFLIEDLDLSRKRRADVVDRTAAAWILQGALDRVRDQATWV
jgi:putative Holliday junction resolvase